MIDPDFDPHSLTPDPQSPGHVLLTMTLSLTQTQTQTLTLTLTLFVILT